MLRNLSCSNLDNYYCNNPYNMEDDMKNNMKDNIKDDMKDVINMEDDISDYILNNIHENIFDLFDDKVYGSNNKVNLEEKYCFDSYNINFRYYDLGNNYSIYNNKSNSDFEYPSLDLDFNDLLNKYNVKKENKSNSFKKIINSEANINSNLISCKCNRNTKNLNKLITMFSGPSNKEVLNEIVSSNLHKI